MVYYYYMKVQIMKEFYTQNYPTFRAGDVVELPEPLAKQFIDRKLVKVADEPKPKEEIKKPHSKSEERRLDVQTSTKK